MKSLSFSTALLAILTGSAIAQEAAAPAYLDDRSDAAAIVKSFYNAVSRHEYARAWGYFGSVKPTRDFETFVEGYRNTASVVVLTGDATAEGAAGSTYYNLPVAFAATGSDNAETVFSGCYVLRLANPQIQDPPFAGLHIEKAELKPSSQPLADSLPERCGDAPPQPAKDEAVERAKVLFADTRAADCPAIRPGVAVADPEVHKIIFKGRSSQPDDPDLSARLMSFVCEQAAYNESRVYYLDADPEGVRELQFATPELDIRYADGDTDQHTVESVSAIGFTTIRKLVNSAYDESSMTLTSFDKWRGAGDASTAGHWLFRDGAFTLVDYQVDASYDGEANPETVLDYNTPP